MEYSLYLVTDRNTLLGRDFFHCVEEALKGGVSMVQLREKTLSSLDFFKVAVSLKALSHRYNVPLIINDRVDIALAMDADGVHIGQEDLPLPAVRRLIGRDKILGYSVQNTEQAIFGQENGATYLGAGPIFPTPSKGDAASPIGTEILKRIRESVSIPVVAIGGIDSENIVSVRETGVDGVSVISAVLGSEDIRKASENLIHLWKKDG